ncbi:MAG: roadblock/LC7 domain-containing protein [Candidatus Melainabacteria bacterium]|jgi:predicted regulator of Ras-like GTPase activity (Roadblock/LC7/MglB family)|uniref:Roadblock/LC7 domain-containing protein n=1 Tax=Candidatus Obscuribacter phosphatis TaxID=1906157 RepID=A0A8J7PNN1_9BACT|nr:roadblock/LC7 domain-containing protein [Candidatus Obscuribacter phosphatis]MBX9939135.1 roadblock/LC7 domain-containing protein [Candidatus Obscuribacterales bacterium]MCA0314498.1 roadblock/LC7 domain-containing protein [Candidatus Melainabacteria bacterium]
MVTPESAVNVKNLLNALNGKHGILGCILVARDGSVVSTSLPAEIDIGTIGALSATLFSNNDVSIQRMNRGNLIQMTLLTDQGILHFYEAANHYLVVLTAKGQRINLEGLIRSVEEQGKSLETIIA